MAKKLLAVMNDNGVANALSKCIQKINEDKKLETIVLSKGPSRNVLDSKAIRYKTLENYILNGVSLYNIGIIPDIEEPDLVFTGFSEGGLLEKYAIFNAKLRNKNSYSREDLSNIKREVNIDNNSYLITFFSQAIKKIIDHDTDNKSRGYNELTVLNMLKTALSELNVDRLNLLVKLHSKEDQESTMAALSGKLSKVIFNKSYNPRKLIMVSELVGGIFSTSLIKSIYLNKDTISIQPNITVEDTLVMNRLRLIVPVYKEQDLKLTLERMLYDATFKEELKERRYRLNLDGKSTERIVDMVYKLLNVN